MPTDVAHREVAARRRLVRRAARRLRLAASGVVRDLGPGLVTGAADDDPSGISTYSIAGASFGFATLWTALFSVPLMIGVQLTCARIGLVTGRGLAAVLRERYRPWIPWTACALLVVANTVNIAADLAGMSEGLELVTGIPSLWFHCILAGVILAALVFASYHAMARWLKGLTLVLFAYVGAAILARPAWGDVLRSTLVPRLVFDRSYFLLLVALFGTTISPYLFFWQTSQEVEEASAGPEHVAQQDTHGSPRARRGSLDDRFRSAARDVTAGMLVSNLIAFFIILTTGATLFVAGQRDIGTAREAALALRPLAGSGASWLFAAGLVGAGLLGVPVLAGSSAYAVAEAGGWRSGMNARPTEARVFYATLAAGLLLGMLLDHTGISGLRLLFWAAVLNGVLAPPLLVMLLVVANDRRTMGAHRNGWGLNVLTGLATAIMTAIVLISVLASVGWSQTSGARSALGTKFGLNTDEMARLDRDEVVARRLNGVAGDEVAFLAAARVGATAASAASRAFAGDLAAIAPTVLRRGGFSAQPTPAELRRYELPQADVEALRDCVIGACVLKLSGPTITAIGALDWQRPDVASQVSSLVRTWLFEYTRSYVARGNQALVVYEDGRAPLPLHEGFHALLAAMPTFVDDAPEFHHYLDAFPRQPLAGVRDTITWYVEDFGLRPLTTIVHSSLYVAADRPGSPVRGLVARKQIFASHYFRARLTMLAFVESPRDGTSYAIWLDRSLFDAKLNRFIRGRVQGRLEDDLRSRVLAVQRALSSAAR